MGRTRLTRRKKALVKLVAASFLLALFAGELTLRLVRPDYRVFAEKGFFAHYVSPYQRSFIQNLIRKYYHPEFHCAMLPRLEKELREKTPEFDITYYRNSLFLRDKEHALGKSPDQYRVIGLGDSFTEGVGTPENATWLRFLERQLSPEAKKAGKTVTTINGGMRGSDLFFFFQLLNRHLIQYDPDLILVAINSTDIFDVIVRGGKERFSPGCRVHYKKYPAWESLYAMSFIARHIIRGFLGYNAFLVRESDMPGHIRAAEEKLKSSLLDFARLAEERHVRLVLVFHPQCWEMERGEYLLKELIRFSRDQGLAVVDLNEFFIQSRGMNKNDRFDYFWPLDRHHNPRGYELFARGISDFILDKGYLASPTRD